MTAIAVKLFIGANFILLLCFLPGCANWARHGVLLNKNHRIRIAVVPVGVTANISDASDIVSNPPQMLNEQEFIHEQMSKVVEQLTQTLNAKLKKNEYIEFVPIASNDLKEGGASTTHTWSAQNLIKLKQKHDVQAVLFVTLAGYGKMKKEWLVLLIGSGVVEGVVQGVLAAKLVSNVWAGVAVGLEEIGSEVFVWGGGSYLFNAYYSPVTLDAKLISTTDAAKVWSDTVFVSVDRDAIKSLPKKEQAKRELQLKLTAKKALNELVDDINSAAKSNSPIEKDVSDEFCCDD